MANASKKHIGAGSLGKGDGSGAASELPRDMVGENDILSNRDKAQHSRSRGLDGAQIQNTGGLYSYQTLEYGATFNGPSQTVGTAQMRFNTKLDGSLYATTLAPKGAAVETLLPASLLGSPHRLRIDWTAVGVTYWVDGVVVATHPVIYPATTAMMKMAGRLTIPPSSGPCVSATGNPVPTLCRKPAAQPDQPTATALTTRLYSRIRATPTIQAISSPNATYE